MRETEYLGSATSDISEGGLDYNPYLSPTERVIQDKHKLADRQIRKSTFAEIKAADDRLDRPEIRELQTEIKGNLKEAIINALSDEYGLFLTPKGRESLKPTEPGLTYVDNNSDRANGTAGNFKPYLHLEGDFSKVTDPLEGPDVRTKPDGSISLIRLTGEQTVNVIRDMYQAYGEEFKTYVSDLLWNTLKDMPLPPNSEPAPAYDASMEFLENIDEFFDNLPQKPATQSYEN